MLVIIVLSGSLWVMHHLNTNMMPGQHEMQNMPADMPARTPRNTPSAGASHATCELRG